ncbi:unnamed protein product, partial [Oncorhynchus mykiss]
LRLLLPLHPHFRSARGKRHASRRRRHSQTQRKIGMSDEDSRASISSSSSTHQQLEKNAPKKREESKASMSKTSKLLSTSAKRIQKELADITLDPPPNCR